MSILDIDKIDIVAMKPGTPEVRLVITDHLPWDEFDAHAQLIQDKVNTYLDFIESGQVFRLEDPRVSASAPIHLVLVLQHAPNAAAKEFLMQVTAFLRSMNLTFEVDVRPHGT